MKEDNLFNKRIIHIYIIIFLIVIILITAGILILRYNIEGEKKLEFKVTKISSLSTAESKLYQLEDETWNAEIMQKNDIFFTIQKNEACKKEDAISKIKFTNFSINKKNSKGTTTIYRASKEKNNYTYSDEFIVTDNLEYVGAQTTNSELLQINNQGGVVGFSVITKDLGTYLLNANEKLASDGTLLKKIGLNQEDINFSLNFDLIIETESGNKYKSNISFDLPTGNIIEEGISKKEDTDLKNVIFKRF